MNIEDLKKKNKNSKLLMNIFTSSLILFFPVLIPLGYYYFGQYEQNQGLFYFLIQVNFIIFCFSGLFGISGYFSMVQENENFVLKSLKEKKPFLKIKKEGFNLFSIESKNGYYIDLNTIPSENIEINHESKVIFYK